MITSQPSPSQSTHISVLLAEAIDALAIVPDGVYVDGTFGRGGHARAILNQLGPHGKLIAFDRDPEAYLIGQQWQDSRLHFVHARFSEMQHKLSELGISKVNGILLDLGVSSPQLDEPQRGFSFRFDGPLDMRMNPAVGLSAKDWLEQVDEKELIRVIRDYGEERFARQIASAVINQRNIKPLETTQQLAELIAQVVKKREPGLNPATRTFQAIRIFINKELEEIEEVLPQTLSLLKEEGRVVVISFHSLEDRLVKQFFKRHSSPPEIPRGLAIPESQRPQPLLRLVGKSIRASENEQQSNPRSRSAIMRIAERCAA
ncbi:16S rRNA (cytosine(1402)-N(4))-methyltransferase RsmH [Ferrovum sp. PN-J185]|uniref:16S rRNA (cytosine(1402)-N(4))-methyltransferase RsmH n=1 Tax=Ferrovum sp. PN-J185 TaxID=1356306 RepID=UPI000792E346|nr:16S rRNA (cytosine(1402)-N(4))-methyltransferase RsmH [Ferrovum sp. PN-J185]KXW56257.1 ribosomal RNA small subunit methyltransferase H [Ferrovum sp. PN-J185]MCC6068981.1 16S rRNA (cytosine(1402)-N(4))-methyltransferase RsmH [Ferrovum sp. PN-J185]